IAALFIVWGVGLYNALVRLKHGVGKAWANIDVLLKQRHEELPKLVDTCKQYMQYEQGVLESVIGWDCRRWM
ncbi:LemA family protein, partial [Salmonella enterica]|uniref:LemA family protein n=1 Tax=Salmonella enterica TaxID=28901 RepID=UPI0032985A31